MRIKPTSKPGGVVVELDRRDDPLMDQSTKSADPTPFRLKNILVPIDFSESSKKALQYALPMAAQFGAKITLITVVEPILYPETMYVPVEWAQVNESMVKSEKERLQNLCQEMVDPRLAAEPVVKQGKAFEEIIAAARKLETDLIIIATHGHTGLKHLFLGSTAERVVRLAPCPVLTVRQREHDFV